MQHSSEIAYRTELINKFFTICSCASLPNRCCALLRAAAPKLLHHPSYPCIIDGLRRMRAPSRRPGVGARRGWGRRAERSRAPVAGSREPRQVEERDGPGDRPRARYFPRLSGSMAAVAAGRQSPENFRLKNLSTRGPHGVRTTSNPETMPGFERSRSTAGGNLMDRDPPSRGGRCTQNLCVPPTASHSGAVCGGPAVIVGKSSGFPAHSCMLIVGSDLAREARPVGAMQIVLGPSGGQYISGTSLLKKQFSRI